MKVLILFLLTVCCVCSYAQTQLPVDETARVSFIEVVKADSLDEKLLYTNAKAWLQANGFTLTGTPADSLAGKLSASHGFFVYAKGYLTKKVHGKITYTTTIEVKNGRYRYNFSHFVFHYYAEDRTFKTNPTGRTKALEDPKASGWQALWDAHKSKTGEHINSRIRTLKAAIIELPKIKQEPVMTKKSTTADW